MVTLKAPGNGHIRPMALQDISEIVQVEKLEGYSAWNEKLVNESFSEHQGWVSMSNGSLLGYAFFSQVLDELTLLNIVTNKPFRQQRVAERLLNNVFSIYRKEGLLRCFLEVGESNLPAQSLYQKMGFKAVGRRKAYYKQPNPQDALILQVDL
jgi:ribosomal-protein-alanine N-acetyltransferase